MRCKMESRVILFCVIVGFMLFSVACGDKTPSSGRATARDGNDKCLIKLSSPPPTCTLEKDQDDRVVWINDTSQDQYVCANVDDDPFEAYAWFVPKDPSDNRRRSGGIKNSTPKDKYHQYDFNTNSIVPCLGVRQSGSANDKGQTGILSNPKIIVQ